MPGNGGRWVPVIRSKLRDKSGVSILMGLIFLLICVMVGTVVLAASTAAAGKLAQQRQSEQDYLNVSSAARLIKDRVCKLTYARIKVDGYLSSETLQVSDGGKMILGSDLKALCGSLGTDGAPWVNAEKKFEISASGGAAPAAWETVYGRLRMEEDGRILVALWLGTEDQDDAENHNHVKIEFCPDGPVSQTEVETEEEDDGSITRTTTVTTTCSWPESGCTITKGTYSDG